MNAVPSLLKRHVLMSQSYQPIAEIEPLVSQSFIKLASGDRFVRRPDLETDTSVVWMQLPDFAHFVTDSKIITWFLATPNPE